nr:hypothetical protein CFP56_54887 [Quercus suber]
MMDIYACTSTRTGRPLIPLSGAFHPSMASPATYLSLYDTHDGKWSLLSLRTRHRLDESNGGDTDTDGTHKETSLGPEETIRFRGRRVILPRTSQTMASQTEEMKKLEVDCASKLPPNPLRKQPADSSLLARADSS